MVIQVLIRLTLYIDQAVIRSGVEPRAPAIRHGIDNTVRALLLYYTVYSYNLKDTVREGVIHKIQNLYNCIYSNSYWFVWLFICLNQLFFQTTGHLDRFIELSVHDFNNYG